MARPVRHSAEIETDRLFLLSALQRMGRDTKSTDLAVVLNRRRAAAARETALALGKSPQQAESAALAAQLSPSTVKRDLRIVRERAQTAATAIAGVFLDEQIAECAQEIERSYLLDEQILEDLERSRRETKTITRAPMPEAVEGEPPPRLQPTEIVQQTSDTAGRAALYSALLRNAKLRVDLRAEMRALRFGKQFATVEEEGATIAGSLTGISDPAQARETALALYAQEIEQLSRIEQLEIGPTPPEIARLQRLRLARHVHKVRMIREFVDLSAGGERDGGRFEIRVLRAPNGGPPRS